MPGLAAPYHVDAALQVGLEGCGVTRDDALSLISEAPQPALLDAAAAVRDRFKGRSVSYSRKVFIPLTHLCRDYCGYCTFRADPQPGVQPVHDRRMKCLRWPKRAAGPGAKKLCSAWAINLNECSRKQKTI